MRRGTVGPTNSSAAIGGASAPSSGVITPKGKTVSSVEVVVSPSAATDFSSTPNTLSISSPTSLSTSITQRVPKPTLTQAKDKRIFETSLRSQRQELNQKLIIFSLILLAILWVQCVAVFKVYTAMRECSHEEGLSMCLNLNHYVIVTVSTTITVVFFSSGLFFRHIYFPLTYRKRCNSILSWWRLTLSHDFKLHRL